MKKPKPLKAFSKDGRFLYTMIDGNVHCMPNDDIMEHVENALCWCEPKLYFRSARRDGREVWTHNRRKDLPA